ncbi:MAG: coproporphyrinogen III oxidase family protein [Coriobacteriia bacterium]|nr:coproporphyrinogen III oxidase family protein [Coriobacteriia bacterium]
MLAERLISGVMRKENQRLLMLEPADVIAYPKPVPGRTYMLYVHIPFCESLCPYCSFNRFPYNEERAVRYFKHLRTEMKIVSEAGYDFESLYIGGGTPTINIEELVKTIDMAKELFSIKEVSAETNPNHLHPKWIEPLQGRIDRFSVGVQSFDDGLLKQMDRFKKYGSAEEIVKRLKSIEGAFPSMNVDMIFNFPTQTPEMLAHDLEIIKETGCNQTTFYPLMASPAVEESLKRTVGKVDYAREARYYQMITEGLSDKFTPASAWTFSRTGGGMIDEYIVDYEEYIGIGSGAMSFVNGTLFVNSFSLKMYGERVEEGLPSIMQKRVFTKHDLMRYRFLMQLFGLSLDREAFKRDFGVPIEKGLAIEINYMRAVGAFEKYDEKEITLTSKGRYLLVAMMRQFFIGVNNVRDSARAAISGEERKLLFGAGTPYSVDEAGEE